MQSSRSEFDSAQARPKRLIKDFLKDEEGSFKPEELKKRIRELLEKNPNLTDDQIRTSIAKLDEGTELRHAGVDTIWQSAMTLAQTFGEIMRSKERIVLLVGAITIALLGLFPPWVEKADIPYKLHFEKSLGYRFIVSPPSSSLIGASRFSNLQDQTTIQIDFSRLFTQWVIVGAITVVVLLILRSATQNKTGGL